MVAAVSIAIELMQLPMRARQLRSKPLPDGVTTLLQIASGDTGTTRRVAEKLGRSTKMTREAAEFFIVQILLAPEADSYRILGANPNATARELRHNMALLLRWLHPDLDPKEERSMFAAKVTRAWEDLKTPERRSAYDRRLKLALEKLTPKKGFSSAKAHRYFSSIKKPSRGAPAAPRLSRMYIPKRIGLFQRLLIHLLGRPIL